MLLAVVAVGRDGLEHLKRVIECAGREAALIMSSHGSLVGQTRPVNRHDHKGAGR